MYHEIATSHGPVWVKKNPVGRPKKEKFEYKPAPIRTFVRPKGYSEGNKISVDLAGKRRFLELVEEYKIKVQLLSEQTYFEYQTYYRGKKRYLNFIRSFLTN